MPIFDYSCPKCGNKKNDLLVSKHDQEVLCDKCDTKMNKCVSAPSIGGMDQYGRSE